MLQWRRARPEIRHRELDTRRDQKLRDRGIRRRSRRRRPAQRRAQERSRPRSAPCATSTECRVEEDRRSSRKGRRTKPKRFGPAPRRAPTPSKPREDRQREVEAKRARHMLVNPAQPRSRERSPSELRRDRQRGGATLGRAAKASTSSPRPHWELGEALGILDFDRAAKISGAHRFAVLSGGLGARLERALINFMLDVHTKEHGYREMLPPFLVERRRPLRHGTAPQIRRGPVQGARRQRKLCIWCRPRRCRSRTCTATRFSNADLELPKYYTAFTPCFRSEAGSYGKDVRGLIRQHQFNKVELVKITDAESSYEELEKLTANAETILQAPRAFPIGW